MIRTILRRKWNPEASPVLTDAAPLPQLPIHCPAEVMEALARVGRSEDLRFSPDGTLVAIAGFSRHVILVIEVAVRESPVLAVELSGFVEIRSAGIGLVHGIDFIDERTMAVANRDGSVALVPIPPGALPGAEVTVEPLRVLRGPHVQSPGSVAVVPGEGGLTGLVVCNNYVHRVVRYDLDADAGFAERGHEVVARWRLEVPDGIAISHDGTVMAISNHDTHDVKLFRMDDPAGPDRLPIGTLGGLQFAHGLRFTPDDCAILVADAGAPYIHTYECGDGWVGDKQPVRSHVVIDRAAFIHGHVNPQEGGPKGVDIHRGGQVVAMTCGAQPLAFYPLRDFLAPA
ncbi:MAG: hypothetical protein IT301_01140 [Dehalococcoidia bacterium]|nr:hypothetical protein [Dehalococcoidia bacterium]